MGEHADDEIDRMIDEGVYAPTGRKRKRKFIDFQSSDPSQWRDNDGKHWNMSDMTFNHINNVMKLLESKGTYPEKLRAFKAELAKRHEQWKKENYPTEDPTGARKLIHERLFTKPEPKIPTATTSQEEQFDFFDKFEPDN